MAAPEEGNLHVRCQQHQDGVLHYLGQLLTSQAFADVTICCQNRRLKAHRILLSACSHYLQRVLLAHKDPDHITLILHDIDYCDMKLLLDFMYTGAVSVSREGLARFLQAAETLQVRVLNRHTLAKTDCDIDTAIKRPDSKTWAEGYVAPPHLDVRLKTPAGAMEAPVTSVSFTSPQKMMVAASRIVLKQQHLSGVKERHPRLTENKYQARDEGGFMFPAEEKYKSVCCSKVRHADLGNKYEILEGSQHMYMNPDHILVGNKVTQKRPQVCGDKYEVSKGSRHSNASTYPEDQKYTHESNFQHLVHNNHISEHPLITLCKEHQLCGHKGAPPWARPLPCLMPITPGVPEPTYLQLREEVRLRNGMQTAQDLTRAHLTPLERVMSTNNNVQQLPNNTMSVGAQQGTARDDKVVPKVPRLTPILPPSPWAQHNRPPCVAPRARNPGPVRHWNPGLPQEATSDPENRTDNRTPSTHRNDPSGKNERPAATKRSSEQPPVFCRLKERRLQEFYRDQRSSAWELDEASDLSMKSSSSLGVTTRAAPCEVTATCLPQETCTSVDPARNEEMQMSNRVSRYSSPHHVAEIELPKTGMCENAYAAEEATVRFNDKPQGVANGDGETANVENAVKLDDDDDDDDEVIEVCETLSDRNNNATPADTTAADGKTAHGCEDCGKCFSRRQLLVQHRRIHTGERPYTCAECGKQFTQRGHWSSHQKLHGPARRPEHACSSCGKGFVTRASLKVHLRTHTGEKPFQCTECGKQFSQLRNYKYHRSVHEGTREFAATCPECGKYFNDRGYLSSHMKIHRNRKEYACGYCGKSFNQRVAYNMHVRIHTGERPHSCPHCNKSFSRKMLLKQHLRIHTGEKPFACEVCGKAFADRSNMTLHMRLHSGIKPYTCSTCNKAFTKKHHLKTHMNYHTGIKPYACTKCGLRFSQSSNMRTHYKKCSANNVRDCTTEGALQNVTASSIGSVLTPTSTTSSSTNDERRTTLPSDVITPPHSDESSCSSSVNTTNQTDK